MSLSKNISINQLSQPLVTALINDANALNLNVYPHATGATIVDAGIEATGGLEVGRRIAEICMGGLGQVSFVQNSHFENWPAGIQVTAKNPVLACLGSQYAGWALSFEKFFSLGSGPARCIAQREDIFSDIQYKDSANKTVLILETDKIPPAEIIAKVVRDTNVSAENLTFILTPTRSLAGTVQIVARVLEVALHKLHTLHFPLEQLVDGIASAPLPPPSPDFLTGMGRTNDAILFGGFVQLFVQSTDEAAKQLAADLPSNASKDYGKPFAQVFKAVNMDFYQIDPLLFSPAKVTITNLTTGNSFFGGAFNEALLNQSFGA
ncbi:methenyltetrahydromethanopterin cyclohydrolase [Methylotenera versatilis]|uniref:methenyltetrahydromethanopterin cyclohydrolase n=1 Tax=Methylotenera versatilis TaxID=1055487 RepID=UPI000645A6C3|nr:methenyltetrahydromethanopterin cyclohydrolase [Methylotenera versatilis]